jgi:hypothetical protein
MASAWGSSWGSAWGNSWGSVGASLPNRGPFQCGLFQPNVFQNDCPPATSGAAVGHSGKPRRKRHYVEIDNQYFEVRDHDHAVKILAKLHEAAKEAAKAAVETAVAEERETPPPPVMRVVKPDYRQEFVQQLQAQVDAANAQIAREWTAAEQAYGAQQQALARLMHERWVEQDEEDIEALIALGVL